MKNDNKTKVDMAVELRRFVRASLRNWKLYAAAVVAAALLSVAYMFVRKPATEINANLMLPPEVTQSSAGLLALSDLASSFSMGDIFGSSNVDNEIAVLSSHSVLERTVRQLGLNIAYLEKERILRTLPAYDRAQLHLSVDPAIADTIRHTLMFIVWPDDKGEKFDIEIRNATLDTKIAKLRDVALPADIKLPHGDFRLEKTEYFNTTDVFPKFVICYDSYNAAAQALASEIEIFAPNKKTDIISMSVITSDPAFGKNLLSSIIDNYNWLRNHQLAETQRNDLEFIEKRLVSLGMELDTAQTAVQEFKVKNKITEPEIDASILIQKAATLDAKIASTSTYNEILRMTRDFIADPANDRKMIPSMSITTLSSNETPSPETPSPVGAIEQYNGLILKLNEELSKVNTSNSTIETIEEQLAMLRANICESISRTLANSNVALAAITRKNNETLGRMGSMPELEREYINLERNVILKQQLYLFLLKQKEDAQMGMTKTSDALITLDQPYALTKTPGIKPAILCIILLFLGFVAVAILVFRRKMPQTPIGNLDAMAKYSSVPVLGTLAKEPLAEKPFTPASVRMLRSDICAILNPIGAKTVMTTSVHTQAGSADVAAAIASSMADSGHRTLLVDATSGDSATGPMFAISPSAPTLASICRDKHTASPDAIAATAIPGLHLLPSGCADDNAADLLASPRFAGLMKELSDDFDYIIIASQSISEGSGAYALASVVDLTLVAADAGTTTPDDLAFLSSLREQGRFPRLSLAIS